MRLTILVPLSLVVGVFLTGLMLPAEHTRTSRAVVDRSPEVVWRVLTDLDGMPLWRTDLTAVQRLPDLGGRPAWREVGRGGSRTVELSQAEPPRRLVMQRTIGGRPAFPVRTFDLLSTVGGTLIVVTELAEARNPLGRVLVRLNIPGSGIDRFLRDLEQRMNQYRHQVAADGS
jgi:uncharacterized protein YndB with AHSA1/START domain